MSDPFKEFLEQTARLAVPEDDTEESRGGTRPPRPSWERRLASSTSLIWSPATTSSCARGRWRSGR